MSRLVRWMKVTLIPAGILLIGCGCLPDNFWADTGAELVNRSIFAVINAALGFADAI
jgi:hypothetical protein